MPLSIVTPLAYDYRYAYATIRSYYDIADEIILGLDAERLSWMRKPFQFNLKEVADFIKSIDHAGKMRMVEGNFHSSDDPMQNDSQERSELSQQCQGFQH